MYAKLAADQLFRKLDTLESGKLTVVTPDGQSRQFQGVQSGETAKIELKDWRVIPNMIQKGDIGFAEDYRAGYWETDNLVGLTTLGLANRSALDQFIVGSKLSRTISMLSYLLRLNTLSGSRKNIHAHYDLGNDFYGLWLDPSMSYSAAIYKNQDETLEQAQNNKYDRILDSLRDNAGSVLEIGCGWGGFAERALGRGDFDIKGITLSEAQYVYASERVGVNANIALEDYRHQQGKFDHIVSIEMFEAVGEKFWNTYFTKISSLLKRNGRAVIQTITMNERDFPRYRRGGDFIRSYVFPGGMLPSPSRFKEEATKAGLRCDNEYFFGQDYARTLEEWLNAFDRHKDQVLDMGFDEGFIRLWRFYLAGCIAGFRAKRTNVMQVELSHA
jgi:cyclopropane-fatty-acyl-phospholipid synthase